MSQYTEHEKLKNQSDNFHLLMEFAEYLYDGNSVLQDIEDGTKPLKGDDLEKAVYSFLGLNMEKIKEERKQMEEQLKKQANEG